jgi:hypothetical protein
MSLFFKWKIYVAAPEWLWMADWLRTKWGVELL